jgi:septum formation protein
MLREAGFVFRVDAVATDEVFPPGLKPAEVACAVAEQKASASSTLRRSGEILLCADTVVSVDQQALGKPADDADALRMLSLLSGRTHEVHTAVALVWEGGTELWSERTEVDFAPLSERDAAAYVARFQPGDKAGAYAIQEWVGLTHVLALRGCYYNVVGLPMPRLYARLTALGAERKG